MQPIHIEFSLSRTRQANLAKLALLVAGLLSSSYMVFQYSQIKTKSEKIKSELTRLHTRQPDGKANPDDKELEIALQRASAVIDKLAFPWDKLFRTLESSTANKDVALLSIQPDIAGAVVTLSAEAKNWNAMLRYIKLLSAEQIFSDVHLVNHKVQLSDPQKPVRFILSCAWSAKLQEK